MWVECAIKGCRITPFFGLSLWIRAIIRFRRDSGVECASADSIRFDDKCTISHSLNKYDMSMRYWCRWGWCVACIQLFHARCPCQIMLFHQRSRYALHSAVKITACHAQHGCVTFTFHAQHSQQQAYFFEAISSAEACHSTTNETFNNDNFQFDFWSVWSDWRRWNLSSVHLMKIHLQGKSFSISTGGRRPIMECIDGLSHFTNKWSMLLLSIQLDTGNNRKLFFGLAPPPPFDYWMRPSRERWRLTSSSDIRFPLAGFGFVVHDDTYNCMTSPHSPLTGRNILNIYVDINYR